MNDNMNKDRLIAHPVWSLSLSENEEITGLVSPITHGTSQVASYGKVLANRTTLYKYLNPHMSIVLTAVHGGPVEMTSADTETGTGTGSGGPGCGVYIVDTVKGSVLYHASLPAPGGREKCDVKAALSENWLVYHYYDPEEAAVDEARGWKMVSVELYEGDVDEKTKRFVFDPLFVEYVRLIGLDLVRRCRVSRKRWGRSRCLKIRLCLRRVLRLLR